MAFTEKYSIWHIVDSAIYPYWVFYCSIIIVILNITQVPYMSSIIAHEDMGIYAYVSIFDAIAKLGVAFTLTIAEIDKLKLYAVLMAMIQLSNILFYRIYCIKKYTECHLEWVFNKPLAKQIFTFSGWNIFGGYGKRAYLFAGQLCSGCYVTLGGGSIG